MVFSVKEHKEQPYFMTELVVKRKRSSIPLMFAKCQSSPPPSYAPNQYVSCSASGLVKLSPGDAVSLAIHPTNATIIKESTYMGGFFVGF